VTNIRMKQNITIAKEAERRLKKGTPITSPSLIRTMVEQYWTIAEDYKTGKLDSRFNKLDTEREIYSKIFYENGIKSREQRFEVILSVLNPQLAAKLL